MFGYPDMQEILRNIQANDDRNDVAVFEDVQTPVNEPPPQFQDGFYDKAAVDRVEWVWGSVHGHRNVVAYCFFLGPTSSSQLLVLMKAGFYERKSQNQK